MHLVPVCDAAFAIRNTPLQGTGTRVAQCWTHLSGQSLEAAASFGLGSRHMPGTSPLSHSAHATWDLGGALRMKPKRHRSAGMGKEKQLVKPCHDWQQDSGSPGHGWMPGQEGWGPCPSPLDQGTAKGVPMSLDGAAGGLDPLP